MAIEPVLLARMKEEFPVCLVDRPLVEFKPGETVLFRRSIGKGFWMDAVAAFVRIERGLVVLKPKKIVTPDHYRNVDRPKLFPGGLVKVKPTSCFLWGQSGFIGWNRVHRFKDLKTPL